MKKLLNLSSGILIFVLIVILLVVNNLSGTFRSIDNTNHWLYRTLTAEELAKVNDSMPAYQYRRIEDSIRNKVTGENISMITAGAGWVSYSLATSTDNYDGKENNYLYFSGYQLKDPFAYFFKKDGNIYFAYADSNHFIRTKRSKIKFINDRANNTGQVFIPVSYRTIKWLNLCHLIVTGLLIGLCFYFLIVTPLNVLYRIARGDPFNDKNIGGLHLMAWVLLFVGISPGIVSVLSYLAIRSQIPSQIEYNFFHSLMHGWNFIVAGLVCLLIAKAFLKGSQLQLEQDLTV